MTRILLPGRLVRHIADVRPAPLYGPGVVEYEIVCDGTRKIGGDGLLDQCDPIEDSTLTCPRCRAAHQPTDAPDPTMGTIPLFDL
jgi:hypothetical protein